MHCRQCGQKIAVDAKFCNKCGAKVDPSNTTEPVPQPQRQWSDRNTIIVLSAVMVVAIVVGLGLKQIRKGSDSRITKTNAETVALTSSALVETTNFQGGEISTESDPIYDQGDQYIATEIDNIYESNYVITETTYQQSEEVAYILADSNSRYLTKADLAGFNAERCRLARNEIYARHGRMFKDELLQAYFSGKPWYHASIAPDSFAESRLNQYEIANRNLIVEYEKENGYNQ